MGIDCHLQQKKRLLWWGCKLYLPVVTLYFEAWLLLNPVAGLAGKQALGILLLLLPQLWDSRIVLPSLVLMWCWESQRRPSSLHRQGFCWLNHLPIPCQPSFSRSPEKSILLTMALIYFISCVRVLAHICLCTTYMLCPHRPEDGVRSLELEIKVVVRCQVSTGNPAGGTGA